MTSDDADDKERAGCLSTAACVLSPLLIWNCSYQGLLVSKSNGHHLVVSYVTYLYI